METTEDNFVTTIVSRQVKPGCEARFEAWVRGVVQEMLPYPGYLGMNIIRPHDHTHPEYVLIFRFDSYTHMKAWQESATRRDWLERVQPLIEGDTHIEHQTGLEYWFTPADAPTMPPRYKQAVLSWLALCPLVFIVSQALAVVVMPLFLRIVIQTAILIFLMTYVVMPRVTRLFGRWLFR